MAITQTRMLALIRAAQDYQRALDQITEMIANQAALVQSGERTVEQAAEIIFLSGQGKFLLGEPVQSAITISAEAHHFKLNKRRNERTAEKQRARRGGGPSRTRSQHSTTAPDRPLSGDSPPPSLVQLVGSDGKQVQAGSELEFEAETHESGTLTEGQKIEAERFVREQEAREQFERLMKEKEAAGMGALEECEHTFDEPGETCRDCGKVVPSNG